MDNYQNMTNSKSYKQIQAPSTHLGHHTANPGTGGTVSFAELETAGYRPVELLETDRLGAGGADTSDGLQPNSDE